MIISERDTCTTGLVYVLYNYVVYYKAYVFTPVMKFFRHSHIRKIFIDPGSAYIQLRLWLLHFRSIKVQCSILFVGCKGVGLGLGYITFKSVILLVRKTRICTQDDPTLI
jgi:hypothetical protein